MQPSPAFPATRARIDDKTFKYTPPSALLGLLKMTRLPVRLKFSRATRPTRVPILSINAAGRKGGGLFSPHRPPPELSSEVNDVKHLVSHRRARRHQVYITRMDVYTITLNSSRSSSSGMVSLSRWSPVWKRAKGICSSLLPGWRHGGVRRDNGKARREADNAGST